MAAAKLPDSVQNDSISSHAGKCQHFFRQYMEKEREYKREVSRCHSRFLTWASFLGVFARESVSLDRRLQYEPEIKDLTLSMLGVLEINLKHGRCYFTLTWSLPEMMNSSDAQMYARNRKTSTGRREK